MARLGVAMRHRRRLSWGQTRFSRIGDSGRAVARPVTARRETEENFMVNVGVVKSISRLKTRLMWEMARNTKKASRIILLQDLEWFCYVHSK
jgi:hypothetical protein